MSQPRNQFSQQRAKISFSNLSMSFSLFLVAITGSLFLCKFFSYTIFFNTSTHTHTHAHRWWINVERTYSRTKINVTFFTNVFRHECPSQTLHWSQSSDNDVALLAGTHGTRPSAVCRANSCRLAPTNRTPPSFQHFVLTVPFPSLSFLSMKL